MRRQMLRWARKLNDLVVYRRVEVIFHATAGRSAKTICALLDCVRSHVYRTVAKFSQKGLLGLFDGRLSNGQLIADEEYDAVVAELVAGSPREHGFLRPTWTRELLIIVAERDTGKRVSLAVMSRVLQRIKARRGRPKPIVRTTLSKRQLRRRAAAIRKLLNELPEDEVVVYEDEVDIHLNPKVGLDWMAHGQQKQVTTPGQNKKAYIAGTLDAVNGTILWVGGAAKNSALFIEMIRELDRHYANATCIHVILDNYSIHKSGETQRALSELPRIKLCFLPPYCPDLNKIERLWQELHANVTRNHQHSNLVALCHEVAYWLKVASPWLPGTACPVPLPKATPATA